MPGATGLTLSVVGKLPEMSVVLDRDGFAWQKLGDQTWHCAGPLADELFSRELHRDCRPLALLFDPDTNYVPPAGVQVPLPKMSRAGA